SRIVRWELLKGLPAEGPVPKHFHTGHPTPWTEDVVLRFFCVDNKSWLGNFQGLQDWGVSVLLWREADALIVLARDNFYLVSAMNPDEYQTLDPPDLVDSVLLDESQNILFVADTRAIHAFNRDCRRIWTQSGIGWSFPQLKGCSEGVLLA